MSEQADQNQERSPRDNNAYTIKKKVQNRQVSKDARDNSKNRKKEFQKLTISDIDDSSDQQTKQVNKDPELSPKPVKRERRRL